MNILVLNFLCEKEKLPMVLNIEVKKCTLFKILKRK